MLRRFQNFHCRQFSNLGSLSFARSMRRIARSERHCTLGLDPHTLSAGPVAKIAASVTLYALKPSLLPRTLNALLTSQILQGLKRDAFG